LRENKSVCEHIVHKGTIILPTKQELEEKVSGFRLIKLSLRLSLSLKNYGKTNDHAEHLDAPGERKECSKPPRRVVAPILFIRVGTQDQHAPDLEPHRGADRFLRRYYACQL
jgi:hypothetical protein